jgi:hypothetical protein
MKTLSIVASIVFAAGICLSTQAAVPANQAFKPVDTTRLKTIGSVLVVNGESWVFDKKSKSFVSQVLKHTDKVRLELMKKLSDKYTGEIVFITDDSAIARLSDPFWIIGDREKKQHQKHGNTSVEKGIYWSPRSWSECENCPSLAERFGVDAILIVWGQWFKLKDGIDTNNPVINDKDKGDWLHVSGQMFDAHEGKLLAWTSINRSGIGIGPFVKWGAAYGYATGRMVKFISKHTSSSANGNDEPDEDESD